MDSSVHAPQAKLESEELRLAHWLDELKRSNRFILLALDRETTPWSRMAVRQADRL